MKIKMARKDNIVLLIESFQNGEFQDFYDVYNKFKEKAIKDRKCYEELLRQFPSNLSEEIMKPWQKSFLNCIEFVEICAGLQNARFTEERLKRKKSDMINHIVSMLKENMMLYGGKNIKSREKFFSILVYTDILTAFPIDEDKYTYLGILWDLLRQIDSNMEANIFYGEGCKENFLKRSKRNLKICGFGKKEIQQHLEVESKEYICRYLNALIEFIEQENPVEQKASMKRTKSPIQQILLPVGCVLILIIGFVMMGVLDKKQVEDSKKYKELKVQYEKVLEENQKLEQTQKDLAKTKKDLESKIQKLEKQLLEQQANEGETLVLEEVCQLLEEADENSSLIQMLQPEVEVTVLEDLSNGWLKVIYQGEIGYISYSLPENE